MSLDRSHHLSVRSICEVGGESLRYLKSDEVPQWAKRATVAKDIEGALGLGSDDGRIDAVLINTPNAKHYGIARSAIQAGCHVYVERPIVQPTDDLPALLDLARQRGVTIFTGVQRRLEAPFQYIRDVVQLHRDFGELAAIRCTLSTGQDLKGWRRQRGLAGGGIIIDSGYHLLDIAIWVASAVGISLPDTLDGHVHLGCLTDVEDNQADSVEQTAHGLAMLTENVQLTFDFTYSAPLRSIYERVDFRDKQGTQVSLTRDQAERTAKPGVIRHQRRDGSIIGHQLDDGSMLELNDAQLPGQAMNTAPLASFLHAIETGDSATEHPCHGKQSVATWRLIRELYRLGRCRDGSEL